MEISDNLSFCTDICYIYQNQRHGRMVFYVWAANYVSGLHHCCFKGRGPPPLPWVGCTHAICALNPFLLIIDPVCQFFHQIQIQLQLQVQIQIQLHPCHLRPAPFSPHYRPSLPTLYFVTITNTNTNTNTNKDTNAICALPPFLLIIPPPPVCATLTP